MQRALILGGTGVLGLAIAHRLADLGWKVDLTGRDPAKMPSELKSKGVQFLRSDRYDAADLRTAVSDGTDLLVDAQCFTAAHAEQLMPYLPVIGQLVMLSSKGVYVDPWGRHINSDISPQFQGPVSEQNPTVSPAGGNFRTTDFRTTDFRTRSGYGPNKVAAENTLLNSNANVTVIRASKVHGAGAQPPREWMFVRRILDQRSHVFLAKGGMGTDHTTAAVNTAALVGTVASLRGKRILNSADPHALSALEITRTIAAYMGHSWEEVLLETDAPEGLGAHPWDHLPPFVLETSAAKALGYVPVGDYQETIGAQIEWLLAAQVNQPAHDDPFFEKLFNYLQEDEWLRNSQHTKRR